MATETGLAASYVFLSYASADRERAFHIADLLEARGISVWLDRKSIAGGTSWSAEIVRGIQGCAGLVALCSAAAMASPNVHQEIQLAWENRRPILPLLLEHTHLPEAVQYALAGRQWVEVLDSPDDAWLPRALRPLAALGLPPESRASPLPPMTETASAVPRVTPARARHNLPAQLTSFVGRQGELAELGARLRAGTRLLTLTGTGGCGKTRLALQVAADLSSDLPDGVWLVELAPLTNPELVAQTVAAVVDVREEPNRPLLATLAQALRAKRLLLLLDNCEHLVEASARLADALLRGCPDLQILATSREALAIPGEVGWRVPSLAVPAADHLPPLAELVQIEAVRLFLNRAEAVVPGFAVTSLNAAAVAHVCRRLDGIPLALELAAARLKGLSAEQLAGRLDRRFRLLTGGSRAALPRQQTLAALVGWSYDLLSGPERALFDRLAVFAGGFTLEAAEAVCADEGSDADGQVSGAGGGPRPNTQHLLPSEDVLDLLLRLVEKSLVIADHGDSGPERYRLLETLRQYAQEKLVARGEVEFRHGRHADYFSRRLAEVTDGIDVMNLDASRMQWLEREHDNLRAALHWLRERGDAVNGLRLIGLLGDFWMTHGYLTEGRKCIQEILELPGALTPTKARAAALYVLAGLARRQTDYAAARSVFAEALTTYRTLGDVRQVAKMFLELAMVSCVEAAFADARAYVGQSRTEGEWTNDADLRDTGDFLLGSVSLFEGDYPDARRLLAAVLHRLRQSDGTLFGAYVTNPLGWVAVEEGDLAAARAYIAETIAVARSFGDVVMVAEGLQGASGLAVVRRQFTRAVRLAGAAAAQGRRVGAPIGPAWAALHERWLGRARQELSADAFVAAWQEGQAMTLEQAIAYALSDNGGP
jgi:non-specific serine/threonine protein kinase